MGYDKCPKCGNRELLVEKDSSSGNVMRDYYCPSCRWSDFENEGVALWQALSDLREQDEEEKRREARALPWFLAAARALALGGVATFFAVIAHGGFSTPEKRAWVFLGSQTLLETFLVMTAFLGKPIAGLRRSLLRADLERPAGRKAWIGAGLVVLGYCGLSIAGGPAIAAHVAELTGLKALCALLAVVTGIFEEGFFRRFLMDRLRDKGRGAALQVLASGLVFGAAHLGFALAGGGWRTGFYAAAYTTVLGMSLAVVYLAGRRNLLPCVVAHFLINLALEPGLGLMAAGVRWDG